MKMYNFGSENISLDRINPPPPQNWLGELSPPKQLFEKNVVNLILGYFKSMGRAVIFTHPLDLTPI